MKIEVDVTQEDINNGRKFNCIMCPVALAIKRAIRNPKVSVFSILARIDTEDYFFPKKVQNFIQNFDGSILVEPIKFELDISESSIL